MFRYLPLVLKNSWRNKRRTILTVISIGISMCLLGVMIAMFHAFYLSNPSPEQALRLVTRNRVSFTVFIPLSYRDQIEKVPGVRAAGVSNWFGGVYKDDRDPKNNFARFAVEPDKFFRIFAEFRMPEDQQKAFRRDRTACIVGRDLADQFHFQVGDRIHLTGTVFPGDYEFTIRGIFDSPRNSEIMYFNTEYMEQSLPESRRGNVIMYNILIDDPAHSARIAKAIDAVFLNSTAQTKTETAQAFNVAFLALLGNIKMFLIGISAAVMFTVLLVSANTMAMSARERVREVGIRMALGARAGDIVRTIVGQGALSVLAGIALGIAGALTLSRFLSGFLYEVRPTDAGTIWIAAAVYVGVALAAASTPAYRSLRVDPLEALRHE
jgi:putative ABC transport system permease protein